MNVILLSGGSGKRLWPLSNENRSKQFLPLLSDGKGGMESMVQRVVRQIRESGIDADITFATNSSQKDIILNQLGEGIGIVLEPERRDTFPAIALSCSYLSLEKRLPDDEIVVIMPCDPYTEAGYFETVGKMAEAVNDGAAEMVLMGIKPSCPSSKFGYIVPSVPEGDVLPVRRFVEKPAEDVAEGLLAEGALWNGGVFAFRLGYMMNIVRKYVDAACFAEMSDRYGELPKISFDYEVAEKASSVAAVPYCGSWKDLGTWNSLTEELECPVLGNALLGPSCRNVNVVSEIGIPIFVDGLSDAIVAASPDGVLVCSKDASEDIKKHVGDLGQRPMQVERLWGSYRVIDYTEFPDGFKTVSKYVCIKAGRHISYQLHYWRSEAWNIVDGEGAVCLDGKISPIERGSVVNIPAGCMHGIKASTDLVFIEVQSGIVVSEDDVERLDYEWFLPEEPQK